jgi:hypothetical protein
MWLQTHEMFVTGPSSCLARLNCKPTPPSSMAQEQLKQHGVAQRNPNTRKEQLRKKWKQEKKTNPGHVCNQDNLSSRQHGGPCSRTRQAQHGHMPS